MSRSIPLSDRLQAVADLVTAEGVLADIGTDHAYLPIYLIQKKKIRRALALDVREGPLHRAKEHIDQYGMGDYIEIRLSDGAKEILPGEADILVLAGMGGGLMERIIDREKEVFFRAKEVILQPQSEQERLRRYLTLEGWSILAEDMVKEDGKYYPMMRLSMTEDRGICMENPYEEAGDIDYRYGAYLLRAGHPVLREFLEREERIYRDLLKNLNRAEKNDGIRKRIAQIEQKAGQTQEAIERMS